MIGRIAAFAGFAALVGLGIILWTREGGRIWMSAWTALCG